MPDSHYTSSDLRYSVYYLELISMQLKKLEKLYQRYHFNKPEFATAKLANTIEQKENALASKHFSGGKLNDEGVEALFTKGVRSIGRIEFYFKHNCSLITFNQGECSAKFPYGDIEKLHKTSKDLSNITQSLEESLSLAESTFIAN